MMRTYPIVAQKKLAYVPARGILRRRVRQESELLQPSAHEVLVYRVHGQFVVDHDVRRASDDQVAEASHVSLVDITADAPVLIELKVRSADAADFTVHVTFRCTVTDPVLIVRNGLTDAKGLLSEYLRSMPDVFEMGQDYRLSDLDKIQRALSAFIVSSVLHDPPVRAGMKIRLAGVQVLTPVEVEEFEKQRREQTYGHEMNVLKATHNAKLHSLQQAHDHLRADREQEHDHLRADRQLEHDIHSAERTEQHDWDIQTGRVDRRLDLMRRYADTIGSDPELAVVLAMASGELGMVDAAQMLLDRAERRELAEQEAQRQRAAHDYRLLRELINSDAGEFATVDREKLDRVLDKMIDNVARTVDSSSTSAQLDSTAARSLPGESDRGE